MNVPQRKFDEYIKGIKDEIDTRFIVPLMQNHVMMYKCKSMLELGVSRGYSTIGLLMTCPETGGHLWSVDNANEKNGNSSWRNIEVAKAEIKRLDLDKYWTYTECNDLKYECNGEYDLIFIDTSHDYLQTFLELQKFSKHIKVGGVIFLHDTFNYTEGTSISGAIHTFLVRELMRTGNNDILPKWVYTEIVVPYGCGMLERLT